MSVPATLAAERTSLAWTRTGLAALANGALLLLRVTTRETSPAGVLLVVAAVVVAVLAVVLGQVRSRARLAGRHPGTRGPAVLGVAVTALCVAVVAVVPQPA